MLKWCSTGLTLFYQLQKKNPVFFLHRLILLDLRTNRMQKIKNIYEDQADYSYRSVKM